MCLIFCHIHTHICTGNSDILNYLSQVPSRCSLILLPQGILSSLDCSFELHRPSPDRLVLSQANLKSSLILHLSTRLYCLTSKYLMSDSVSQNPPIPLLSTSLASFMVFLLCWWPLCGLFLKTVWLKIEVINQTSTLARCFPFQSNPNQSLPGLYKVAQGTLPVTSFLLTPLLCQPQGPLATPYYPDSYVLSASHNLPNFPWAVRQHLPQGVIFTH